MTKYATENNLTIYADNEFTRGEGLGYPRTEFKIRKDYHVDFAWFSVHSRPPNSDTDNDISIIQLDEQSCKQLIRLLNKTIEDLNQQENKEN